MKTDMELRDDVLAEIEWEPAVDGGQIGVAAHDGVVTLSGNVATYLEKTQAVAAAKRVSGVSAIADEIEVAWSSEARSSDTVIAESIHRILDTNLNVPKDSVQATVREGRVTLEGSVHWPYQRLAAEHAVEPIRGVHSVTNLVKVTPPPATALVVRARIEAALKRRADIDASRIVVRTDGDRVILEGTVPAFYEREAAVSAAWAAPGVRTVEDHIQVRPGFAVGSAARTP